ncbi:MAG: molecular chaperone TorD family protein [Thermodesulfovibrionales bacterium]|jgi:TorA maturation chaperone TorD
MTFHDDEDTERANLYRLLSGLFLSEPTEEFLIQFRDIFGITITNTIDEITIDFMQLFSDAAGHLLPYESLYNYPLLDTPRLWGQATEEVQKLYHAQGLMIDEEIDIIPDHISAELLFMGHLIENDITELKNSFFENHIRVWVPDYCYEIQQFAQTDFYIQAAGLLKEFISNDSEEFGMEESIE